MIHCPSGPTTNPLIKSAGGVITFSRKLSNQGKPETNTHYCTSRTCKNNLVIGNRIEFSTNEMPLTTMVLV